MANQPSCSDVWSNSSVTVSCRRDRSRIPLRTISQCLLPNVRMVLASGGSTLTLKALADMGDKVIEVALPTISVVQAQPGKSDVNKLQEQITKLTDLVAALTDGRPRGQSLTRQSCSNSRSRHTSPSPVSTQQETDSQ